VYGVTEAMVGMFDLIKKVGTTSNKEATTTASATQMLNFSGLPSQTRCHLACTK